MQLYFSKLTYKQKGLLAEFFYLFVIGVLSPFAVGLQTWSVNTLANCAGYVMVTVLQLPVIILFYRLYLPHTIGKRRYWLFILLLPVYILLYELNGRLAIGAVIEMPFVIKSYRDAISGAHPWDFTKDYLNENIGYTILVLLAGTALYVIKLLFKNQHQLSTLETEKLKLELKQLKSQLHPHFFFNTINNMYALSVQNSPKTPLMIKDLSGIMRYMLYDAGNESVPLKQEINFIKSYIGLESLRHTQTDIIKFNVQGDIEGVKIAPLLFLALIENTFKHALHEDMPGKWVKIALVVDDSEITLQTMNPKRPPSAHHKAPGGIGLTNLRKRLDLLYPGAYELFIDNQANIFTANLTIQAKYL